MTFSIICLSPQEWNVDLPTNRQQIMARAAARGHRVLFVETGDFAGKHLLRLARHGGRRSLARRLFAVERCSPSLDVVKAPNIAPWGHTHPLANAVNSQLLARRLRRLARTLPRPIVLWIYDPCAARVLPSLDAEFGVYDCVDDYAAQVADDDRRRRLVEAANTGAAASARLVFATSSTLFDRLRRVNANTYLVPNAGDYEHFRTAADRSTVAADVRELPRPVVGFAGNMLASKVDFSLLEAIALRRPNATVLLVGPARPETRAELAHLCALPNVHWVGAKAYAEVPRYVAAFDVALIPYLRNRYTESCFPLKVYEYLAAGKPIVASGLPELAALAPDVTLADGERGVLAALDDALVDSENGASRRRMERAAANTWETRTSRLLELVERELASCT